MQDFALIPLSVSMIWFLKWHIFVDFCLASDFLDFFVQFFNIKFVFVKAAEIFFKKKKTKDNSTSFNL